MSQFLCNCFRSIHFLTDAMYSISPYFSHDFHSNFQFRVQFFLFAFIDAFSLGSNCFFFFPCLIWSEAGCWMDTLIIVSEQFRRSSAWTLLKGLSSNVLVNLSIEAGLPLVLCSSIPSPSTYSLNKRPPLLPSSSVQIILLFLPIFCKASIDLATASGASLLSSGTTIACLLKTSIQVKPIQDVCFVSVSSLEEKQLRWGATHECQPFCFSLVQHYF